MRGAGPSPKPAWQPHKTRGVAPSCSSPFRLRAAQQHGGIDSVLHFLQGLECKLYQCLQPAHTPAQIQTRARLKTPQVTPAAAQWIMHLQMYLPAAAHWISHAVHIQINQQLPRGTAGPQAAP